MNARIFSAAFVLPLCATLSLGGCASKSSEEQETTSALRSVKFARVERHAISGGVTASGQLMPREEAAVAPQLSGYQVRSVAVDQGARVRAGQTLAVLDDTLLRSEIAQQQAAVSQQSASAEQAQQEAARVSGLGDTGVLSEEALRQRTFSARTARAQLGQAQAQLADKRIRQRLMVIRAPVDGRVLERSVRPGDVASPSTVMFRIARGGQVELNAEVPERDLSLIKIGQQATVTLADGTKIIGRVRLVGSEIDAQTRLGRVRVLLPVRDDVRAGGFASVVFGSTGSTPLAVPEASLTYDGSGAKLMVLDDQNKVSTRVVKVGRRGGGRAELIDGPPEGTRILLRGQNFVLDGDQVTPVAATAQELR